MVIWLIDLMTRVFVFSFPSGKRSDRVQYTGRFWAHFRATDFAAPMVVTVWSSDDEFQALAMRLAARVLLPGTAKRKHETNHFVMFDIQNSNFGLFANHCTGRVAKDEKSLELFMVKKFNGPLFCKTCLTIKSRGKIFWTLKKLVNLLINNDG